MKIKERLAKLALIVLTSVMFIPTVSQAAPITSRSVTLGSSAAGATTTHAIAFTIPSAGNVGAVQFLYCTTAYNSCTTPTGLDTSAATLSAQSGEIGFTMSNGTQGAPYITRTATNVTANTPASYTLGNIINPTTANTEYWIRITTYAATTPTGGSTDDGVVAFSTANQIVVSGTMPESLVFCVGTSGTDCTNITGTSVGLGVFSPTATNTGTSVMSASTNAAFGYAITIAGTTMTSGANTIPAMGTQTQNSSGCAISCTSSTGTSQYGTNVKANTSPSVGAAVSGLGTASGSGGYNTINSFRYMSGDTVAAVAGVSKSNLFTNSYIVNVGGDQAAGVYTATMTYICTATF